MRKVTGFCDAMSWWSFRIFRESAWLLSSSFSSSKMFNSDQCYSAARWPKQRIVNQVAGWAEPLSPFLRVRPFRRCANSRLREKNCALLLSKRFLLLTSFCSQWPLSFLCAALLMAHPDFMCHETSGEAIHSRKETLQNLKRSWLQDGHKSDNCFARRRNNSGTSSKTALIEGVVNCSVFL